MIIRNDMVIKLHMEVKKHEHWFAMYLLCIDTTNKKIDEIHCLDVSSHAIVCVKGS